MKTQFICFALLYSLLSWAEPISPMDEAYEQLTRYNFKESLVLFRQIQKEAESGSNEWLKATFGLAVSCQHNSPPDTALLEEAEKQYKLLVSTKPESAYGKRAKLFLGRLLEIQDHHKDEVDLEGARTCYSELSTDYPNEEIGDEALLRLAGTYTQQVDDLAEVKKGVVLLEEWLTKRPDNPLASAMYEVLAEVYFTQLGERTKALDAWLAADERGLLLNVTARSMYWRIAVVAEQEGRLDTAIAYYQKIITDQARSGRAFDSQLALKRLQGEYPDRQITIPKIELFSDDMGDGK